MTKSVSNKDMMRWINALRSGKYTQTKNRLQDSKGYCCLGVACDIFIPRCEQGRLKNGFLKGYVPWTQKNAPRWLRDINDALRHKTSTYMLAGRELSALNDEEGLSFDEIADILQLIYIEGAL